MAQHALDSDVALVDYDSAGVQRVPVDPGTVGGHPDPGP